MFNKRESEQTIDSNYLVTVRIAIQPLDENGNVRYSMGSSNGIEMNHNIGIKADGLEDAIKVVRKYHEVGMELGK